MHCNPHYSWYTSTLYLNATHSQLFSTITPRRGTAAWIRQSLFNAVFHCCFVSLALTRDVPASYLFHVMGNKNKGNNSNVPIIKLIVKACSEPALNTWHKDKHGEEVVCSDLKKAWCLGLLWFPLHCQTSLAMMMESLETAGSAEDAHVPMKPHLSQ